MAERVDAAASATGQCEQAAAGTATISREVAKGVNDLKSTLVRLMRTKLDELDRRQDRRFAVDLRGELRSGGQTWAGEAIDVSASGVRLVPNAAASVRDGDTAALSCAGLPPATVRVAALSETAVHLAFVFATSEEKEAMARAVTAVTQGRKVA